MRRVPTLLEKLQELAEQGKDVTVLDIDLMLDYTRVLYADLLEIRKVMPPKNELPDHEEQEVIIPEEKKKIAPVTPSEKYAEVPDIDIRSHIGINDKYVYISELFNDDKSAYDTAIKELNSFTSKDPAMDYVENQLSAKYNWNEESETVQSFYSLVISCFSRT